MKITIEGTPKEIAALVVEIQEQQDISSKVHFDSEVISEAVQKAR